MGEIVLSTSFINALPQEDRDLTSVVGHGQFLNLFQTNCEDFIFIILC